MTVCKPLNGSLTRLSVLANPNCLPTPVVERVIATTAIVPGTTTSVTIGLDPAYVAGGYTATTTRTLYANTVLFFGVAQTPVKVLRDYVLTTTAIPVEIAPTTVAVAANTVADSYLAGVLCLESKQINSQTQNGAANEDCDQGLLKNFYTGVTRDMAIAGQLGSASSFWALLSNLGDNLSNVFFYLDYNRLYGEYGVMQLSPFGTTGNQVGSVVTFTSAGSILSFARHLPANQVGVPDPLNPGTELLTSGGLIAQNTYRRLFGFQDLTIQ